jgi:anoctamin-10/anoctamin-7
VQGEELPDGNMTNFSKEIALEEYDDTFSDYAEIIIQYGYVVLFGAVWPVVVLLALVELIIEIRVDAFKLCTVLRRPLPKGCEDIGTWGHFLEVGIMLHLVSMYMVPCCIWLACIWCHAAFG